MTNSELVRYIRKQGIKLKSHGKKHDVYVNPVTGEEAQILRHSTKEVATGTKDRILEDLGLK